MGAARRLWVLGALWLSVLAILVAFRVVVLPFAAAALIAYLVAPLVGRLNKVHLRGRPIPRWVAILLIYAAFFAVAYLLALALLPQLYGELARVTRTALEYLNGLTPARIEGLAQSAEAWLAARGLPVDMSAPAVQPGAPAQGIGLSLNLADLLQSLAARSTDYLRVHLGDLFVLSRAVVGKTLATVFMTFFVLMVAAYMSIDAATIKAYGRGLVPPEYSEDIGHLVRRIDRSLAGVVRGQVTICLVNGLLTLLGLWLFGVKFAFLLSAIATVLSLIPIFGAILSSVPIVAIAASQGWQTALAALLWIVGIHALEAYALNPKIMGSAARIHPVVVAFALIAGERKYGLVGALFAVPIAAIVVACFDFARQKAQGLPVSEVTATDSSPSR